MKYFPYLLVFAAACFVGASALVERRRWVWFAGWVVLSLSAIAVCHFGTVTLAMAATPQQQIAGALFLLGGAASVIWWAKLWWAVRREFLDRRPRK